MIQDFYIRDSRVNQEHSDILQIASSVKFFIDTEPNRESLLEFLGDASKEIKRHITIHFYDEESLFHIHKMPEEYIKRHQKEHNEIRKELFEILDMDVSGLTRKEIAELAMSIIHRIEKHILEVDKEMNDYLPA